MNKKLTVRHSYEKSANVSICTVYFFILQPIYTLATRVESPEVMPQPSSASVSSAWDWEEIYPP